MRSAILLRRFPRSAGEVRPQQGNIWLHHRDITRDPVPARARAGIGRGFQQTSLFTGMTLRENLSLASGGNRAAFEAALGAPVLDEMALYERQQQQSACCQAYSDHPGGPTGRRHLRLGHVCVVPFTVESEHCTRTRLASSMR